MDEVWQNLVNCGWNLTESRTYWFSGTNTVYLKELNFIVSTNKPLMVELLFNEPYAAAESLKEQFLWTVQ